MSVMANRVQSFSQQVASVIVGWFMRKGKELADEMFSGEMVGYIDVLRSRIIDRVLHDVDGRGIICHTRYGNSITELCECVEVPECLTRCCGKCHIICICGRRGNGLLFLPDPGYFMTISHTRKTRCGTTCITTRRIIRVREGNNRQRN